jgi:hypothetical protein
MFDLRQLVWTFSVVVGAASLFGGIRLLRRRAVADGRGPPLGATPGLVFAILGAGLIALAAMGTVGPWRPRHAEPFPMRVLDLSAPPAAIERARPLPLSPAPERADPLRK